MRYCKDIAYMLFWVFWKCLAAPIKCNSINLQKPLMFICAKSQFISHFFLEILQRFCKLAFFSTLGMIGYVYQNCLVSTCRKAWWLTACKKSSSSLLSFVRSFKDIRNFLFWVLWASLDMDTKKGGFSL